MSRKTTRWISLALGLAFLATVPLLAGAGEPPLTNWTSPAKYTLPPSARKGLHTAGDIAGPEPFIPIAPCRQYNSLSATPLLQATNRAVTLTGAPCGIPATAKAVAVNITIFNINGAAGNGVLKVDTVSPPVTAWINYPPTEQQRGNAGVVSLNVSGQIWVQVAQGAGQIDFVVDTNGYFGSSPATSQDWFEVDNNSSTFTIFGNNSSTTCSQDCGVVGQTASGWAVYGLSFNDVGVYGSSFGSGIGVAGVWGSSTDAIGTYGHSTNTNGMWADSTTFDALAAFGGRDGTFSQGARNGVVGVSTGTTLPVYGAIGQGMSSSSSAAGIFGTTNQAVANAGYFTNTGAGTITYIGTQILGTNYDIFGSGRIQGNSLNIIGAPKNFVAPHPLDPSKEIVYASVEAPTVDVYFRGTGTLSNGYAHIEVPDHFRFTAREGTYMTTLTPVGRPIGLSVESEGPEGIVVRGSGNASFHYVVYAERAEIVGYEPVQKNVTFTPEAMEKIQLLNALPESTKALLVKNGTLNPDGSYNLETAGAMGWTVPKPIATDAATRK